MMYPKDTAQPDKRKACRQCGTSFTPARPMQSVCSPICATRKVKADKKEETRQTRERKEALKRIPDHIREAQHAFNAYIRLRDKAQSCICCGKSYAESNIGGSYDCGHYRSIGSASHLRFNEDNAHGQRKFCNQWGVGRAVDYRIGLVARIGRERVEALENNNLVHKWTADELRAIKAEYKAKLKELQKQ